MSAILSPVPTGFAFDNSFVRALQGLFVPWQAAQVPAPAMVAFNHELAEELGLDARMLDSPAGADLFSGNRLPEGASPVAQAYAGHQFGGFSPRLGDGRALLLGELIDRHGRRRDLAFKGSGRTPFSRGGDGKAALGPVLREYLIGEAMHALGIPTTRALAVVATGEPVFRESVLPGAVLTRVAASHLRVGSFQYAAAQADAGLLARLADYVIERHYPAIAAQPQPYLALLRAVAARQAALVAQWMGVGFIHGVMNTDNMTLSGETIDYGPCAFMDRYDPATVFSSIDTEGRYAYGNQPIIARWNLARLAETLLPLLHEQVDSAIGLATEVIDEFPSMYQGERLRVMGAKLGLDQVDADDDRLVDDLLGLMQAQQVDFTSAFRRLADALDSPAESTPASLSDLFADGQALARWLARWRERLARQTEDPAACARVMRSRNPIYIARNHRVEEALARAVEADDLGPFDQLLAALRQPFDERADRAHYAEPAPIAQSACYKTYCGT